MLVGADRVAANGDTANKVGTYPLAVLAARHGIPFYVCAPTQLGRPRDAGRLRDRHRGARRRRGPRVPRRAHRPARHRRAQPRLRRHAGRAHHRHRHRGGRPAAARSSPPARRHRACARALGVDARLPRDPAGTGRRTGTGRRATSAADADRRARQRSATDGHRRRRPARLDRHPRDDRQGPPALLPRARPAVCRLRHLRPRGARVRAHPLGDRLRRRRADRARARVQRPDPAAALRDGQRGRHRGDPARPDPAARRLRRRADHGPARDRDRLPRRPGPVDGPDVGRPGAVPSVPGDGPAAPAGRDRRAQPALPARLRVVAAVDRDRRRASTTACASTASWSRPRAPTWSARERGWRSSATS